MVIFIDIDRTICYIPDGPGSSEDNPDYSKALPMTGNIRKANRLYEEGHEITYWTARGSKTGKDWEGTTRIQLEKWGAKYHHLMMGKPYYDLYIDDKVLNTKDWV